MAIRSRWIEVISGIAAFALALLTWGLALFAPVVPELVRHCVHDCPQFHFISQIDAPSNLKPFMSGYPGLTASILAVLAATAAVAIGACLQGIWRLRGGRWPLWGGSLSLSLLVSAMSISPSVDSAPLGYFFWPWVGVRVMHGPHAPLVQLVFPYGPRFAAGLLIVGLGPGLCAVLAIIASVAAAGGGDGSKGGGISAPAMPLTRRGRAARVEVLTGVGAFALALLALALWLLAPVYQLQRYGYACGGSAGPCVYSISPVESSSDLSSLIHYFAIIVALILAYLVASAAVAVGAYLHGGRRIPAGRWLLWGGSLSLPILLSTIYVLSLLDFQPVFVIAPNPAPSLLGLPRAPTGQTVALALPLFSGLGLDKLVMIWAPAFCAVLAIIASVAAVASEYGGAAAGEGESGAQARSGRIARTKVLAGAFAFALALLTWALWLFAPIHRVYHQQCGIMAGSCNIYISLVDGLGGPGNVISYLPSFVALILAFLAATAAVAVGAYLHGGRRVRSGRWLVWGGSLSLPVLVSVISVLPLERFIPWFNSPFPRLYGGWLPYTAVYLAPGPDMLVLGWGLGLCAGLAVIALVAMAAAEAHRQPSR